MIFGPLNRQHALVLQRRLSTSQRLSGAPVHRIPKPEGEDFRPPWVYLMSRLVSLTVIPAVAFYSVFFYDFGDREHVFQPVGSKIAYVVRYPLTCGGGFDKSRRRNGGQTSNSENIRCAITTPQLRNVPSLG
ncbi:uncharacterized protein LACBIDRAFT_309004 [Laccaria bicolor S238N-H82]|uniref:Predicted protein n=1 Tax=Laccaria bicolor (strain S238N-H82 / ATCC MYA-4686) TaxID=486041 RepID=B0CVA9_LACBS|nr:uncharacterized protein LACBIDRAFT_309004 [Laccaria bicolor S238N-H82]EDR13719.1 predicted protein [Laccaria bicolor S238N-H82]|eukprot:XP_001876217.1 predicted protein [Laccaria bicolor S238N-H82]